MTFLCMGSEFKIFSRTRAGYVDYNDVDLDWHWIYSLKITTTQITITGNTLTLTVS
jgi:hypothetical protein